MDLRDKLKNKLKNTGIEVKDKNLTKVKKRLVSGVLDVDKQQKLKVSKSDKIIITDNTSKKINEQKTTSKSFSTPLSKSQVDNFVNEFKSSALDSPSSIGKGGSSDVRDFLDRQMNSSLDSLVDEAKGKALQEVNHLINRKMSKGEKHATGMLKSIYNSAKDIPKNPNIGNNPYKTKALNAYESKPEVLTFGKLDGQPSVTFRVAGADKPNTKQMFEGGSSVKINGKKIIKSVNLPAVAGSLDTSYAFNYEEKDKPFVEGAATKILSKFSESVLGGQSLQANSIAVNPNQEQVFTSVNFRSLNFEYIFLPKNENESKMIEDIIFMFKYWSHPSSRNLDARTTSILKEDESVAESLNKVTKGSAKYVKLLNYPSMWEISYNDGVGGSAGVNFQTKKCYCKSLDVSYGSSEGLMLFEKTNKPTLIKLSMNFIESEYILQSDIDGGF